MKDYKGMEKIKKFVHILIGKRQDVKDDEKAASKLRDWITEELSSNKNRRPKNRAIYGTTETALRLYLKGENCPYLTNSQEEHFPMKMNSALVPYLDPTKTMQKSQKSKRLVRKPVSNKKRLMFPQSNQSNQFQLNQLNCPTL